ncbi:cyclic peptide export ABC transporter [Chitinophaga varians]|uniref:Cyclic peptide export ABC transporter n=1 Tax=Chitinophaga varians TaxID=2202339 RepID=A0A847S5Z8_9BACT|nr:cyclic peptide export ABC transporter [Chitinophaga varians]NLR68498.1 cyclic peptide export ABC transporter [Chitinophaga varians]
MFRLSGKNKVKVVFYIISLAMANGAVSVGLLVFIDHAVRGAGAQKDSYHWGLFMLLILLSVLISTAAQRIVIRLTNNLLFEYEMEILNKFRKAGYLQYLETGTERVYAAIEDTRLMGFIPTVFTNTLNAGISIACCIGYFFLLSSRGAVVILVVMFVLLLFYFLQNKNTTRHTEMAREMNERYFMVLKDLLYGFREIKMNVNRNENLYNVLYNNRAGVRDISSKNGLRYLANELIGRYSWYIVIGLVIFWYPVVFEFDQKTVAVFVSTALMMVGPVNSVVTMIPYFTNAKVAQRRLNYFDASVAERFVPEELSVQQRYKQEAFETLEIENVKFHYSGGNDSGFSLGPLNLRISRGDIVFVTGGNGSGKSTLINLLTGLFMPDEGAVKVNGRKLEREDLMAYRHLFSTVFIDPHLFHVHLEDFDFHDTTFQEWLHVMKINKTLRVDYENNKINTGLSKGQQKRLALIFALMEKRQILVLDEWAAEQDPAFRHFFYTTLLPLLKERGITQIVVTHDDHYFSVADHVVKLNYGMIETSTADNTAGIPFKNNF